MRCFSSIGTRVTRAIVRRPGHGLRCRNQDRSLALPALIPFALVSTFNAFLARCSAQTLPNGVAAGDVDQTSAILWARSTAVGEIVFEYATDPSYADAGAAIYEVTDPAVPAKVDVGPLIPGATYSFRVTDAGGASAEGTFRTPAAEGFHGLRFGVSGDWRGELRPYPSISSVPERDLDFFVALGDTIYADVPSLDLPQPQARTIEEFRIKHAEGYSERLGINTWAEVRAATAIYAGIDDHEVTNDFAGGAPSGSDPRFDGRGVFLNDSALYANGLRAFHEYNPIREEVYGDTGDARTSGKRKLYRFRRFGQDAAMFLLDARSFRDEELPPVLDPFSPCELEEFMEASFDSTRTMLSAAQLDQLKDDLLAAHADDITWRFILVPEPIQLLGPILAGDRFEGYAYERSKLLRFIDENGIDNVVFVAADIHGTIVNNLTYQNAANGRWRSTTAFEITTGPVAYAPPLGATAVESAPLGVFGNALNAFYDRLGRRLQDRLLFLFGNAFLRLLDYPTIGLGRSLIDATLLRGGYFSANAYGWTEFEIDADTQQLTVTTYGISWYSPEDMESRPDEIVQRTPRVVSRFRVDPRGEIGTPSSPTTEGAGHGPRVASSPCGALGAMGTMNLLLAPLYCRVHRRRTRLRMRW